jgi:1-deoxy-D-xylulose-5-phosphate synthase
MLNTGLAHNTPSAIRYPRSPAGDAKLLDNLEPIPIGKARLIRSGSAGIALLVFGTLLATAQQIGDEMDLTVVDMRFVKPIDEAMVNRLAANHYHLITIEENVVSGGAGSAVSELCQGLGLSVPITHMGLPDRPIEHGQREELLHALQLDAAGIRGVVRTVANT